MSLRFHYTLADSGFFRNFLYQGGEKSTVSCVFEHLNSSFFETGAMAVPTKSRNPTICGSGDPFHLYLTHS